MEKMLVALIVIMMACACAATPAPAGNRLQVGPYKVFAMGTNLPWNLYGDDFGTSAWGHRGVSAPAITQQIQADLKFIHSYHARVVRWFVFTDGRSGVTFDNTGKPTGIDAFVIQDLKAAVALAKAQGVYLVLSLFDFHWNRDVTITSGVQEGGHDDTMKDASKLAALIANVVIPVVSAFKGEKQILAWEIMNEPEWIISDLPVSSGVSSGYQGVTLAEFYRFASAVSAAVHTHTTQWVTLGSASLRWWKIWSNAYAEKKHWTPLHLDFYESHYYNWEAYCAVNDPDIGTVCGNPNQQVASQLGLDRPMVIGEFYGGTVDLLQSLTNFHKNGYAGAWTWSYQATGVQATDWNIFSRYALAHGTHTSHLAAEEGEEGGNDEDHHDEEEEEEESERTETSETTTTTTNNNTSKLPVALTVGLICVALVAGVVAGAGVLAIVKRSRAAKHSNYDYQAAAN